MKERFLDSRLVLGILESRLQDPANVGAIVRTAAALNVSALWLTPESADVYNPKVVRATSGVLLALPIFASKDVSGLIRQGCRIFAAEVTGDGTVSIDEIHHAPQKLVLAVGNESRGLSALDPQAGHHSIYHPPQPRRRIPQCCGDRGHCHILLLSTSQRE